MHYYSSLFFLSALLPAAASAQVASLTEAQVDSIERSVDLGQVVVTGTRTPKLLANSPILTRVITAGEIRKIDATNISDLLQSELPGIEFSYSMNQQVSLNMQGFGGTSILFLVDGERLAGETLDNVDYNRLNLNNVGRIEIVKGAASSLYGSSAVGGVVNIISRETKEPWTLNLNGKYGAHNEQRYGGVATLHRGSVTSATTAQYTSTDSYDFKNEGDYSRFYGGYSYDVKERLTYQPSERLKLVGRAGYFFRQRNSAEATRDRYRDFSGGLRGLWTVADDKTLELSYTFDQYDKSDYQVQSATDVRKYSNVQNSGRALYNQTFGSRHVLTLGGDVMRDYLESYQFADNGHKSQVTADGFAQLDLNFGQNFNVIAGARYDYFSASRLDHVSSKVSLMYRLGDVRLRGSYAGGFRAPTLKEMYMNFDMASIFTIYGNEELKAEESHNFQLSAEYSHGAFNANFGGFYNNVDDRITTAWSQALGGMLYTNIDRVRIAGVEANVSGRTAWGLGARLSYVYTHEQVKAGQPYTSSTRPHTATARLDYGRQWRHYGFDVALSGRALSKVQVDEYTSTTSYEATERVSYPGYTMWKLTWTHHLGRAAHVTMTVDNLFNYVPKYFYSNSPTTNGTTLALGVSFDVDRWLDK
jgi:outer membrane receptor for ferrienterochelin and colicins